MFTFPITMMSSDGSYVIENAIWFDGSADSLSKTFSSAGTEETWTYSVWVKRPPGGAGSANTILEARADGNNTGALTFVSDSLYFQDYDDGVATPAFRKLSSAVFRDPTAWMHIIAINDTNNSTAADRHRLYVNGRRLTSFSTDVNSSQGYASAQGINSTNPHYIGFSGFSDYFNGYMAEAIFVDGTALTSTVDSDNKLTNNELGEYDDNGVWVPKNPSGLTFGTNGFHLDFKVAPGTGNGAGTDVSGNGNHFTDNSMTTAQQVTDTCTDDSENNIGNYPTWSPIDKDSNVTLSEGSTVAEQDSTGAWKSVFATQVVPTTGKWVWEIKQSGGNPFGGYATTGVASVNVDRTIARSGSGAITFDYQSSSNKIRKFGGGATEADYAGSVSMSSGEAFQFAVDSDAETLEIYINNTKITDSGGAAGASGTLDISSLTKPYKIISQLYSGGTVDHTLVANSADFENNVPSGHKTINTANLPALASAASVTPLTGSFTGNGVVDGPVVYLGYKPDTSATSTINSNTITWGTHADALANGIKLRTGASSHNTSGSNSYSIAVAHPFGGVGINQAKSG